MHTYGHPVDADAIGQLAAENEIAVIEDAAEAHGAEYGEPPGREPRHRRCLLVLREQDRDHRRGRDGHDQRRVDRGGRARSCAITPSRRSVTSGTATARTTSG